MKTYLVGGAVRNAMLGREVSERDWVVVGAKPEEMLKLGYKQVGKQFPVFLHPKTKEEYALARTEHKTSHGYHGFEFDTSPDIRIEDDLRRRDLTINAIAQDENGVIIDPWGGRNDITMRMLRHISDSFAEDPVRVLRAARFAAQFYGLDFRIAPETIALMKQMVADGEVDYLVAERVWQETAKAFATDYPSVYLKVLVGVGALARIAPELDDLLRRVGDTAEQEYGDLTNCLFKAIDLAPKQSPAVLLAILSLYAYRTNVSISKLSDRWKLSRVYRWMIDAAERFADSLKLASELPAQKLLDFLEQADAIRQRERFNDLLTAYKLSDAENLAERNVARLTRVLDVLAIVRLDVQGLPGQLARQRFRKLQLEAINSL
ncbi:MAG: multifunctional CCA tRNA nucleotidyl transferase/2'3'-cyclic phosphodiesterase/2'nucleotidase/phosphatase [Chromatiales bacterium]|nr:multifunctional CCA tRNA nucleotidyl transferase/2'3'-cyclic phosphodiesterase/2'nucleotidase/phosphatase [Chromatiales bacterium]